MVAMPPPALGAPSDDPDDDEVPHPRRPRRRRQARAAARRFQRAHEGRQGQRSDPHRARRRQHPRARRTRRQGRGAVPFRPAQGQARAGNVAEAHCRRACPRCWAASRSPSPRTASAPAAQTVIAGLAPGDVALLENLRFHAEEEKNDPGFARALAALGDIYVNDAFSCAHRAHASTEAIAHLLPAAAGTADAGRARASEPGARPSRSGRSWPSSAAPRSRPSSICWAIC